MLSPARFDLAGDRQTACFGTFAVVGIDLGGGDARMQVRDRKDGGTLRADLLAVGSAAAEGVRIFYAASDTLTNHIAGGRLKALPPGTNPATQLPYQPADVVMVSLIGFRINETTMEAMPFGKEIGDDRVLWYDVHVAPPGGLKQVFFAGTFTVRAGVTQ